MWPGSSTASSTRSNDYRSSGYSSHDDPLKKIDLFFVGVVSGVAALALAALGVYLGSKALMDAPFPAFCFCATLVASCFCPPCLLFLIPVALISIPMMIKATGATLALVGAYRSCQFAAKHLR